MMNVLTLTNKPHGKFDISTAQEEPRNRDLFARGMDCYLNKLNGLHTLSVTWSLKKVNNII